MPDLTDTRIADYLRMNPVPDIGPPLSIQRVAADAGMARFHIAGTQGACVLTCYEPALIDAAQREVAGLRLGGQMGMAPALLLADEAGGSLGGAVVVVAEPEGTALGHQRLTPEDIQGWLFLLLTLHHLPADGISLAWAGSADAADWWQRTQSAWNACRAAYADQRYRPLLEALTTLHAVVGARVEANRELWHDLRPRPCHGNPVPAHVVRTRAGGGMLLIEWNGFGRGDPALELGRVAALAALSGELSADQYVQFVANYLTGMRDTRDATLEGRVRVFASILPLGFAFAVLDHLAKSGPTSAENAGVIEQVARALMWIQDTLGVEVGKPDGLLAPLRASA